MALKDYYETKSVKAGRKDYRCDCCGGEIPKGTPSDVHTFYPFDSSGLRTHPECSRKFLDGHSCVYCGEWVENGKEKEIEGEKTCEGCYSEETE